MTDKIKLLTISDMPMLASGVAIQARYILEGLVKTGKYKIISLGGAMSHQDYRPVKLEPYGDDWIIVPINGYGDQTTIRRILDAHEIDALWFMTDPRFYYFLFEMADEIQQRGIPLLYNHVWDEFPVPEYNKPLYQCCDFVGCISKLTYEILNKLDLKDRAEYIPHAVDTKIFKPYFGKRSDLQAFKASVIGEQNKNKFTFFYNSRNALRKKTSDVIYAFNDAQKQVGKDKLFLFMHTNPQDQEGANLNAVCTMLGLTENDVMFSTQCQPPETMAKYYQMSDVLVNISSNEGFGLSCLEALSCGTVVLVNKTGGLQDQAQNEFKTVFGKMITPEKSLQGSQHIPYIFDCRAPLDEVTSAMVQLYNMSPDYRHNLGLQGSKFAGEAFSMDNMVGKWDAAIQRYVEDYKNKDDSFKVVNL